MIFSLQFFFSRHTCLWILVLFSILLKPQWLSQNLVFRGFIIWNTGYSNFITIVASSKCQHIDPGGTLRFPKTIYKFCLEKTNLTTVLHNDRYHTNFQRNLRPLKAKELVKPIEIGPYKVFVHRDLTSLGHLDRQGLDYFFRYAKVLNTTNYILLPNHGQPKHITSELIPNFRRFKMRISGSQSRTYLNHLATAMKFQKAQLPIIYKNVWGHLIFNEP